MRQETINFDTIDDHGREEYAAMFEIPVGEFDPDEVAGLGPVKIEARAEIGDLEAEYLIEGEVHFTADYTCARCAEAYPIANVSPFHVRFRPRPVSQGEGDEVEITAEEELDVEFYSERSIPLRELAVEQVQLSVPMKPLCSESCQGLCTRCGVNRNREACKCESSQTDQRWGALQDIRKQLEKKDEV